MKSSIIYHYKFNRGFLDGLLAGIPDDKLAEQPVGITNHPLWQIGHLASSTGTAIKILGGSSAIDDAWREKYGHGSTPVADAAAYPSKSELIQTLDTVRPLAIAALESASDELLNAEAEMDRIRERFGTNGNFIAFLMTGHETFHLGQLSSWRRAIGLGSAM